MGRRERERMEVQVHLFLQADPAHPGKYRKSWLQIRRPTKNLLGGGGLLTIAPGYPGAPISPGIPGGPMGPIIPSNPLLPGSPLAPGAPGAPSNPLAPGGPGGPGNPEKF